MKPTDTTISPSRGFAASVPGAGHIRYGTPCQDASGVVQVPRPAAIVCDGRGSAKLSHFGAQGAVRTFFSQLNVLEPFVAGVLDRDSPPEKWDGICRLFYRVLLQVKLDLAAEHGGEEKDFDFTVAFVVAGKVSIGCFQVGDGAIVLRRNGLCETAFVPDKGEFANQTQFLRPGGEDAGKFHARLFPAVGNTGVAITSDGPEHLMFRQPDMAPGPIFGQLFDDLAVGELCEQDLRDYLTRKVWSDDPRGNDDRSLAVLLPSATRTVKQATPRLAVPEKPHEERHGHDTTMSQNNAPGKTGNPEDETEEEFDPAKVTDVIYPRPTWRSDPRRHVLGMFAVGLLCFMLGSIVSVLTFASCMGGKGEQRPMVESPTAVPPPVETNAVCEADEEVTMQTPMSDPEEVRVEQTTGEVVTNAVTAVAAVTNMPAAANTGSIAETVGETETVNEPHDIQ